MDSSGSKLSRLPLRLLTMGFALLHAMRFKPAGIAAFNAMAAYVILRSAASAAADSAFLEQGHAPA